ncbi:MAG: ABC transporter ATP-binding protein [Phycisphaerales bacterium]
MTAIEASNISKTYRLGRVDVPVLRGASLTVGDGEWVAILGASGSGKSTFLHLLGGLDRPDRGSGPIRYFGDRELGRLSAGALDEFRRTQVGFVFQFYHLLPELTVLENTALGAMIGVGRLAYIRRRREVLDHAAHLLEGVGLAHRLRHRPASLSGGERQRVAVARALMNGPPVLLADEPTGNLDQKTGEGVLDVLETLRSTGQSTVMVTHDLRVAQRADRVVRMDDGRLGEADAAVVDGASG